MVEENVDNQDSDNIICDLIREACTEIMSSKVALSRCHAYDLLYSLYFVPAGRKELSRLGRDGGFLQALAEKVFHNPVENIGEYASAASFFIIYADDHRKFRHDVIEKGAHRLISRLTEYMQSLQGKEPSQSDINTIFWLCEFISDASRFEWANSGLRGANCFDVLLRALLVHNNWNRPNEYIDYNIIWALRNVAAYGGDPGWSALDTALTPEDTARLKKLRDSSSGWKEEWMAKGVRVRISEILNRETIEANFIHVHQHHVLPLLSE